MKISTLICMTLLASMVLTMKQAPVADGKPTTETDKVTDTTNTVNGKGTHAHGHSHNGQPVKADGYVHGIKNGVEGKANIAALAQHEETDGDESNNTPADAQLTTTSKPVHELVASQVPTTGHFPRGRGCIPPRKRQSDLLREAEEELSPEFISGVTRRPHKPTVQKTSHFESHSEVTNLVNGKGTITKKSNVNGKKSGSVT